ncbi:MAG: nicotinate phosphoribosyltransferase [Candidatus Aminicenantes bacterium]
MEPITNHVLLTDLYELTMAASYLDHHMNETATFSLFVREYPDGRAYFVSAGLRDVLDFLENLKFTQEDLHYLESTGFFSSGFLSYLEKFRFTGDVHAMPEGRLFFTNEPILEVTAPMIEAQLVETFIINAMNMQSLIATKAARCVHAARGRSLVDFSLRRTHGIDAGMKVARSSYLAGFTGTSNVMAGKLYGIPISGTMAHSYITAFKEETDAFRAFAESFPGNSVMLVDTYDTLEGTRKAAGVGQEMKKRGQDLSGIRLDSGDMATLSRKARKILDDAGLKKTQIFASGGFDEFKIRKVLKQKAAIDAFGVGTKMGVSADAPYFDMAYKLVQYAGRPVLKLSTGKKTLTSEKQVFRFTGNNGELDHDVIALRSDKMDGEPLLKTVMKQGEITGPLSSLSQTRDLFKNEFSRLPDKYKSLDDPAEYTVRLSPRMEEMQKKTEFKARKKELGES